MKDEALHNYCVLIGHKSTEQITVDKFLVIDLPVE